MKNTELKRYFVGNFIYFFVGALLFAATTVFIYKKMWPKVVFVSRFPQMWYPRDPVALDEKVEHLFEVAAEKYPRVHEARPWLLFVPHAGYDYSGAIAAAGYASLSGKLGCDVKRVIIISPSHYVDFNGMVIPHFTHYQTPLGEVEVDCKALSVLRNKDFIAVDELVYHREHAIDVQVPWIQKCMPQAKIIPLVVGRLPSPQMAEVLAAMLVEIVDDSTVVIVSTDLIHYGKRFNYAPFAGRSSMSEDVQELDNEMLRVIGNLDVKEFEAFVDQTGATICGKNAIKIALEVARQGSVLREKNLVQLSSCSQAKVLAYTTSAVVRNITDVGDAFETVGYGALAVAGL